MNKKLPNFNVFVFSLPRCGSSMMTGIIELLGVNMIYTSEDPKKREEMLKRYKKNLGEYVPNEHFYEITESPFANWMKVIKTKYSGCKVIIPVVGMRWGGVLYQPARVIMMKRDPEEIRQSQEAFYSNKSDIAYIRTALASEEIKLQKTKENRPKTFDYMIVEYQDVLANPKEEIKKIAEFIQAPNRITKAVNSVKPKANRFKKEELIVGI